MASIEEIRGVARQAASKTLSADEVDVRVESAVGSDGDDIFRITLVLPDAEMDSVSADVVVATMLAVKRSIRELGEDRLAVIGYATPDELADDGRSES